MKNFRRHISFIEMTAVTIIWILFIVTAAVKLIYGGDLTVMLLLFGSCSVILTFLLLTPLGYEFTDDALVVIYPKPFSSKILPYTSITKCDTIGSFAVSKKDISAVEVLLTYTPEGAKRKKVVCCHPKKVDKFVEKLQQTCSNMEYDPD